MKRVQVLMSTYHGEDYLAEQIESILAQRQVDVSLLVRDDGSSDRTFAILKSYAGEKVQAVAGNNIGTQKSFLHLVAQADSSYDYFAFADQDDVWHPRKLQKAVEALEREARKRTADDALLYAGNVWYASQDLSVRKKQNRKIRKAPSFGNALVENICMGCTQVFNRSLLAIVRGRLPRTGILHDWWMYMTAAYFGTVVFDRHAYVLYRQHSGNQVGMQTAWMQRQAARLSRAGQLKGLVSAQANDFLKAYADLLCKTAGFDTGQSRRKNEEILQIAAGYRKDMRKKLAILRGTAVYRQDGIDQLVYKLLFGIGYL
ncbi:MAG: glycosyltransferase family 2 protein [Eubacterium sp.]|nr:glycosyltransferase family 2 protein [Eubacterium sp.]